MGKIKVLVADDHALVRHMLADYLNQSQGIEVVATASEAGEATRLAEKFQPDVAVMDVEMPGASIFEAAQRLNSMLPRTAVLYLSASVNDLTLERAIDSGAMGYLLKSETPDQIVRAIVQVKAGRMCFSREASQRLVIEGNRSRPSVAHRTVLSRLTERETEVLRFISEGLSRKEIADQMSISLKTVENHISNMMKKTGLHDRVSLTRLAFKERLIPL